jgi:hypothetical protein
MKIVQNGDGFEPRRMKPTEKARRGVNGPSEDRCRKEIQE